MNRLTMIIGSGCMVGLAGCAQTPASIGPAYVSGVPFQTWSCQQLGQEEARLEQALATASAQQDSARGSDIVGVLLIGLPVSTLSGANVASQIAQIKGQQVAVQQTLILKNCMGKSPAPPPRR